MLMSGSVGRLEPLNLALKWDWVLENRLIR
jgi:hypothetical protein